MKITGIVCEYDPFHNGHRYLIERARETGDAIVCVMSGSFTERGSMAIVDKYTRAEMAVRGGADLVLELPYPYSSASAEFFASAGVSILASIGAHRICFGSEQGDVSRLQRAAAVACQMTYSAEHETGTAEGYFAALGKAYENAYGEAFCPGPNDILGVEYCKAILVNGYAIEPVAVKRQGDGFREDTVGASSFASATAIRRLLRETGADGISPYVPEETAALLRRSISGGEAPTDVTRIESAVLSFFRLTNPEALGHIAELGGGLAHRLCEVARESVSLADFLARAATKKYTDARIRRAVFYAMTGVTVDDLRFPVGYTTVLAANSVGCDILSSLRKKEEGIPVVTKPADGKTVCPRQYELLLAADSLFTLAQPSTRPVGEYVRKNPVIL